MGKLIKTRLARFMMSAALLDLFWSALWGYAYPAAILDKDGLGFSHPAVSPVPIVQIVNTVVGLVGVATEFSKRLNRFFSRHRLRFLQNIPLRCVFYTLALAPAVIQFQTSQATPYMIIGSCMYAWGYFEGERLNEEGIGYKATNARLINVISD